jgi:ABC-type multidrug transport system ATPase subunit
MFKPTRRIIKQWNEVGKIMASVERINEVLERKPAVEDLPGAVPAPPLKGHVEYRDVSFAYLAEPEDAKDGAQPQMRLALRNANLTITPGEVVALVGGSGAGKSTFVQLLPRLYDPHMGQITIDGHDIREWTLDSLRSSMSMVLQEAILFVGTVAENIAYGRTNATREEIIAAAIQANAHEFIEKLPEGYDTQLSERASNLSGGQRQRIAIARAFIRNTPILILDEPTTGLDAESTDLVLSALRTLMRGKSTVIISHDLNLIRNADKIAVVKQGEIVQIGNHRELLKVGGLYADLYHKQFGRAVEEVGGQIKPAAPATPAAPAPVVPLEDDDDEDQIPVVAPKVFQTMMTQALPQPVSSKAFQTMLLQAIPPAPTTPAVPAPAPAAKQAPAVQSAPVSPPAAPATRAPAASAASNPPADKTKLAASNPPADKPKPAIYETTLLRTIPLAPPARTDSTPASKPAAHDVPESAAEQLDLRESAVVQREMPGLQAAFDAEAMREYLRAVLFGKANTRYSIERCAPGKAIYTGDTCVVRYQLEIKDNVDGQTMQHVVVGRIFQDQLACAVYMRDKLAPLAALMRGRPEFAPFAAPTSLIEPLRMAVYVFPIDGELPTLIGATDRLRMTELFNETLPEALSDRFIAQDIRLTPVNYARRYRCVLRYEIDGVAPDDNTPQRRVVYGKVSTDNQGMLAGQVADALHRYLSTNAGAHQFAVPRSLGFRADLQLALLEAIPGTPCINQLLKARLSGAAGGPEGALTPELAIDECARIASTLHGSGIALGKRRTLDGELDVLRRNIAAVRRVAPDLGQRFQAWLERIETYAEASDPLQICFSHGDYTYTQLIFEGTQSGLVDFDTICQAEPALDLGQFLAYLRVAAHKAGKASAAASVRLGEQLGARFLDSYIAAAGDRLEDVERLRVRAAVYEIVSVMRMALHSWQQIKPERLENALAVLEERIACLPQLDY